MPSFRDVFRRWSTRHTREGLVIPFVLALIHPVSGYEVDFEGAGLSYTLVDTSLLYAAILLKSFPDTRHYQASKCQQRNEDDVCHRDTVGSIGYRAIGFTSGI